MAKHARVITLSQMEKELGYTVDVSSDDFQKDRFYSDLSPVFTTSYEMTKKELEEHRKRISQRHEYNAGSFVPELRKLYKLGEDQVEILLKYHNRSTYFRITLDVRYNFGLELPLVLTENEAMRLEPISKLDFGCIKESNIGSLIKLPRELRDIIYESAIPPETMQLTNPSTFFEQHFPEGICDPSGFFFQLTQNISALKVNKQMRQEALPITYQRTLFQLDDMDDFIKFAILIGEIGRNNIESLEFFWLSRSDSEFNSRKLLPAGSGELGDCPKLPALHVTRCVQLLKQCKRLKFLRLIFDDVLLSEISIEDFKEDRGICELCSIQPIDIVEICGFEYQHLEDQLESARWLRGKIQCSK